jgi:ELWxxDGT repeat protein
MKSRSLQLIIFLSSLAILTGLTFSLTYAGGLFQLDEPVIVPASSYPGHLTEVNGVLFFSADDGEHGMELWMTDGTPAGTKLVADIYPGPESSFPTDLTNVNGMLYFSADDGLHGTELWISNGSGAKLFADINPGSIELFLTDAITPTDTMTPTDVVRPNINAPTPTSTPITVNLNRARYVLAMGNQHLYEEPWGGDRGDPCEAWRTGNFDDNDPNYRGFNLELKLTNNTDEKVADDWAEQLIFVTSGGKQLKACYYGYDGMGPAPKGVTSVTFFTVVRKGDYVSLAELHIDDETLRLCFDGRGGAFPCR